MVQIQQPTQLVPCDQLMDDLLDLSWGASSNSKAPASKSTGNNYSSFDTLAAASSSRAGTNYYSSSNPSTSRSLSPVSSVPTVKSPASINANDAFSSLFDSTAGKATTGASPLAQSNMTMAQRLAQQRSLSGVSPNPGNSRAQPKTSSDPWDFGLLSVAPKAGHHTAASPVPSASSPFDGWDAFTSNKHPQSSTSRAVKAEKNSEDDFWSNAFAAKPVEANARVPSEVHTSEDVLGLLSQPVSAASTKSHSSTPPVASPRPLRKSAVSGQSSNGSSRPPSRAVPARTPSPPPHVLGQIVMMGFSVQQARLALAATLGEGKDGQWDVNAALEILASDGAAQAQMAQGRSREDGSGFKDDDDDDDAPRTRSNAPRRVQPSRQSDPANDDRRPPRESSRTSEQQSDILAQASTIGFSVLKSANAYWKTSKAQVQKAVEENKFLQAQIARAGASAGSSGRTTPNSGRPKWMTEERSGGDDAAKQKDVSSGNGGYRDSDDEEDAAPIRAQGSAAVSNASRPYAPRSQNNLNSQSSDRNGSSSRQRSPPPHRVSSNASSGDLLKAPEPERRIYSSPNRRQVPQSASPTAVVVPKATRPKRDLVKATPEQLNRSSQKRAVGNEHFKLGRFGEAVDAYTSALSPLPEGCLARIAILNNRANARLKIGEERKASEDASTVISLLLGGNTSQQATKEDYQCVLAEFEKMSSNGSDSVDAPDALGKALSRRARGYEASEKWGLALKDWQMLVELGDARVTKSAGGMKLVSDGLARCRKVAEGGSTRGPEVSVAAKAPSNRPKPRPPPVADTSSRPSEAVAELRQKMAQAEVEDAERFKVKDAVDAKITNWRAGKETNLRALIASLDQVLWEDLGWKKVGMHELLSESQLKVKYVRAISKVHPDKIGNTTSVEHKMIAGAVFSTLSDAWNAQK